MLYNTLNPIFAENYQLPLQMDTKIFDYLKSKRAVFEVRHYMMENAKQNAGVMEARERRTTTNSSEMTNESEGVDFITLGTVRVPLLHLITKNSGIDGEFVILDDFKQKMGALKIRVTLNHHNT